MNNGNSNGFFKRAIDVFNDLKTTNRISAYRPEIDRYPDVGSSGPMRSKRLNKLKAEILKEGEIPYMGKDKVEYSLESQIEADELENSEYTTRSWKKINASKVIKGNGYSILATQCPKPETMDSFIDLILNSKISTVICLSTETDEKKMFHYWEQAACKQKGFRTLLEGGNGRSWTTIPNSDLVYRLNGVNEFSDFSISELRIGERGENLTVKILKKAVGFLLYKNWPDRNVPGNLNVFEELIKDKKLLDQRKLLVHCSAGVGRTGVFAACFEAMKQIQQGKNPNPAAIVEDMRKYRSSMVQTPEQFDLVCRFIIRNDPKWKKYQKLGWNDPYDYENYFAESGAYSQNGIYEGKVDKGFEGKTDTTNGEYSYSADIYGKNKK